MRRKGPLLSVRMLLLYNIMKRWRHIICASHGASQLVGQVRTPGTSVDAAHIVGKSSKRRVSRFPTAFAIPKCDRGVVETLQPRFGSLRARVRHADKGGRGDEVRLAWRPLRAPRSMGRVAWSRSRCVHRDRNRAGGN